MSDITDLVSAGQLSKERILKEIVQILDDVTSDWEIEFAGGVGPDTHIISELEFESIDVVQFVVQVEQTFDRKDLPFEKLLMIEGRYRDDISVQEVVDFLLKYL